MRLMLALIATCAIALGADQMPALAAAHILSVHNGSAGEVTVTLSGKAVAKIKSGTSADIDWQDGGERSVRFVIIGCGNEQTVPVSSGKHRGGLSIARSCAMVFK